MAKLRGGVKGKTKPSRVSCRERSRIGRTEVRAMPSLAQYLSQYDHEHTHPWNKLLHGLGIPMILASIVLLILTFWRVGIALFVGGWILLFIGHRVEGNRPAFFQGVIYFLVGPIWVAKEIVGAIVGAGRRSRASQ